MHWIFVIIIGFLAGAIAKWVIPGPHGCIVTTLLGIVGALFATWLGQVVHFYRPGQNAGFIGAIVGAVLILAIYRALFGPPPAPADLNMREPSPEAGAVLLMQYDANKKQLAVAYLLWGFLGLFGAHRYYLQRPGSATTLLLYTLLCILLMALLIGTILLLASVLWVLIDALLIPSMVRDCNNRLVERLKRSPAAAMSVAAPPSV